MGGARQRLVYILCHQVMKPPNQEAVVVLCGHHHDRPGIPPNPSRPKIAMPLQVKSQTRVPLAKQSKCQTPSEARYLQDKEPSRLCKLRCRCVSTMLIFGRERESERESRFANCLPLGQSWEDEAFFIMALRSRREGRRRRRRASRLLSARSSGVVQAEHLRAFLRRSRRWRGRHSGVPTWAQGRSKRGMWKVWPQMWIMRW